MTYYRNSETETSNTLWKAVLVGAVVGGMVAMFDASNRKKLSTTTRDMKNSTTKMITKVKENPTEVKNEWQERIKTTSATLKEIINDVQEIYEKVNSNVIEPVNQMKNDTSEIISSAKEATDDLKEIGSKVKDAGEGITAENDKSANVNNSGNVHSIHDTTSSTTNGKSLKQHG
ncbi:YtxH domain-containing protein [Halalkalibacter nanhaiisediminis]|uniref:Uncharacterized membrane-anchored protein YhcB (DUF1043 family) n=1 Tax=Halalkalibacter nanhaiisediminis TaxID=688079 RepID=A0A562QBG9_9BACI|nr:YtxH domain-containing protein [Halalkalibacter nanhaiisediminis]TWI54088.1 uncharacterized membrane-anchored protein YhcB (DUF1043 family) [Halalkalibacter nanhaiisediminis]